MRNPAKTRTCAGCGRKANKSELIRISKTAEGEILISKSGGRGAYICKEKSCLEAAIKRKRIPAILRGQVPQAILDKLSELIGSD